MTYIVSNPQLSKPPITQKNPLRYTSTESKMAFQATLAVTGVPDFGLIHIDPEETAKAFQAYLDTASRLTGVSLDDIDRRVITAPTDPKSVTLVDLLRAGMKLFDAIVWLTAGRPTSHPLKLDPGMDKAGIPSLHDIARSVFYCYFMLVTQARYPVGQATAAKPIIPNFLRTIMGMDKEQHVYVQTICSFEPQKFDPSWAKYVKFSGFGQEVLSRFGLGVAGYRMFRPFALYQPKGDIDENTMKAVRFAQSVARAPSSWDIHPLTRNPNILTARGNLNKNLGNLILKAFTEAEIKEMADNKIIFQVPTHDPNHRNYMMWSADDDISGSSRIF